MRLQNKMFADRQEAESAFLDAFRMHSHLQSTSGSFSTELMASLQGARLRTCLSPPCTSSPEHPSVHILLRVHCCNVSMEVGRITDRS